MISYDTNSTSADSRTKSLMGHWVASGEAFHEFIYSPIHGFLAPRLIDIIILCRYSTYFRPAFSSITHYSFIKLHGYFSFSQQSISFKMKPTLTLMFFAFLAVSAMVISKHLFLPLSLSSICSIKNIFELNRCKFLPCRYHRSMCWT